MRRLRRLIRAAIVASFGLALWAIARPASAATASLAPFCDDRGASAVAPPPALQAPDEAIARARTAPCAGGELSPFATLGKSRGGFAARVHPASPAVPCLPPVRPSPVGSACSILVFRPVSAPSPHGVHFRVERPPRRALHARGQLLLP